MRQQGLTDEDLEDRLYWDSLTFDVVEQWRVVHFPIALAFAVLATAHIVAPGAVRDVPHEQRPRLLHLLR